MLSIFKSVFIFACFVVTICKWDELPKAAEAQPLAAVAPKDAAGPPALLPASPAAAPAPVKPAPAPVQAAKPVPAKPVPVPVKPTLPPGKATDPTVVKIKPSGDKTTTRPRLKDGEKPSDTTLTIRTDDAGKVQSMTVEVKAQAAELKPYNQGGGHHPVAKRAVEGAPGYDAKKALAVPKAELERLGVNHHQVSGAQQTGYKNLVREGQPLTWERVAQIETEALIKGKMDPEIAQATVAKAIQALKESGVTAPMRIPWSKQ